MSIVHLEDGSIWGQVSINVFNWTRVATTSPVRLMSIKIVFNSYIQGWLILYIYIYMVRLSSRATRFTWIPTNEIPLKMCIPYGYQLARVVHFAHLYSIPSTSYFIYIHLYMWPLYGCMCMRITWQLRLWNTVVVRVIDLPVLDRLMHTRHYHTLDRPPNLQLSIWPPSPPFVHKCWTILVRGCDLSYNDLKCRRHTNTNVQSRVSIWMWMFLRTSMPTWCRVNNTIHHIHTCASILSHICLEHKA